MIEPAAMSLPPVALWTLRAEAPWAPGSGVRRPPPWFAHRSRHRDERIGSPPASRPEPALRSGRSSRWRRRQDQGASLGHELATIDLTGRQLPVGFPDPVLWYGTIGHVQDSSKGQSGPATASVGTLGPSYPVRCALRPGHRSKNRHRSNETRRSKRANRSQLTPNTLHDHGRRNSRPFSGGTGG